MNFFKHSNYPSLAASELSGAYYNSAVATKPEPGYSCGHQEEKRTAAPLSNMLSSMVSPAAAAAALYHNPYAHAAAATAYYNNPYYSHHQYPLPAQAPTLSTTSYTNATSSPIDNDPLPEKHVVQKMAQVHQHQHQHHHQQQHHPSHHNHPQQQQQHQQHHQNSLMSNYEFNANGNNLLQNQNCAVPDFSSHSAMPKNQITNPHIKLKLQDASLWKQFSQIGTEMIITKCGRRMFPALRVSMSGLEASAKYVMVVDIVPVDDNRYKYHNCEWIVSGKAEAHFVGRGYLHPDSPLTGAQWSKQIVSFHKLKLTNNPFDRAGHIILNSMHKYVPRVHIIEEGKSINTFVLAECVFTAVTAYQNELITKLKIEYNPFAKGFRDGQSRQGVRVGAGQGKRGSDDEGEGLQRLERAFGASVSRMDGGVAQHLSHAR